MDFCTAKPRPCGPSGPLRSGDRGQVFGGRGRRGAPLLLQRTLSRTGALPLSTVSTALRPRGLSFPSDGNFCGDFHLWALERRGAAVQSPYNKRAGLVLFSLPIRTLVQLVQKFYHCVRFGSISVIRLLPPSQVSFHVCTALLSFAKFLDVVMLDS